MVKILSPNGKLFICGEVTPYCETKIPFNGREKFIYEPAVDMDVNPTAIVMKTSEDLNDEKFFVPHSLYVGNLSTEKVAEIMEKLLTDGYYDFSKLEYQKVREFECVSFDNGKSLPYTNDITSIPELGYIHHPPVFCGGMSSDDNSYDGNPFEEDNCEEDEE